MSNPGKWEIDRSLTELGDAEAIAIMEGRIPVEDGQHIHEAAASVARGVMSSTELEVVDSSRGNITKLITQQPWIRLAAAAVVGALVVTLANPAYRFAGSESSPPTSIATANVIYLDVLRSLDPTDLPTVRISEEDQWVTLVGYPEFVDTDLLTVSIETFQGEAWSVVQEQVLNASASDSVVVVISAEDLEAGRYRLQMKPETPAGTVDVSEFVVVR